MEGMEEYLAENYYGISPYLIVGIAKAESTYGKKFYHWKDYNNYNYWGIKPPGGIRKDGSYLKWYNSPEEGVKDCARILKEVYFDQGFNTVDKIVTKYVGGENKDRWIETVNSVARLEKKELVIR